MPTVGVESFYASATLILSFPPLLLLHIHITGVKKKKRRRRRR